MTLTIHQASVPVFVQGLKGLKGVLTKAAAHVDAKKLDPDSLLKARLFPDMFPLLRQVQIATDFAKGCTARLAGEEVPAWDDVAVGDQADDLAVLDDRHGAGFDMGHHLGDLAHGVGGGGGGDLAGHRVADFHGECS